MTKVHKESFDVHKNVIVHLITSQAGSLAKAILEGIQNSVDAAASEVAVSIDPDSVTIEDNGHGIRTLKDVRTFFGSFGNPQSEEELQTKTYGYYRIGRGQMFAYGVNRWHTNRLQLNVDFRSNAKGYEAVRLPADKKRQGTRIDIQLYDPLSATDMHDTVSTLERWVKYSPVPVTINDRTFGMALLKDPQWTEETDDCYFKLRAGSSLEIYNCGVYVMDASSWKYGVGGVLVSKHRLGVNMARNDVNSSCPAWKRIRAMLEKHNVTQMQVTRRLDDYQRKNIWRKMHATGQVTSDFCERKFFKQADGRAISLNEIRTKFRGRVTFAEAGDRAADALIQRRHVCVLDRMMFEDWMGGEVSDFETLLKGNGEQLKTMDFEEAAKLLGDQSTRTFNSKDWTPREQSWMSLCDSIQYAVWRQAVDELGGYREISSSQQELLEEKYRRQLTVGESITALGWTDGSTYIAFDRTFLKRLPLDLQGVGSLAAVYVHELEHDDDDLISHTHDHDFYERYHDRMHDLLPLILKTAKRWFTSEQSRLSNRVSKAQARLAAQLQDTDSLESLQRDATALEQLSKLLSPAALKRFLAGEHQAGQIVQTLSELAGKYKTVSSS